MPPHDLRTRLTRLSAALMLCFYALPSPAQDILTQAAPAAYEQAWLTVYPQVKINGSIRDGIEPFMSRNGVLYARPESLRAYGIALPDALKDETLLIVEELREKATKTSPPHPLIFTETS